MLCVCGAVMCNFMLGSCGGKVYQLNAVRATETGKLVCTRVLVTDVSVSVPGRGARKCKMFKLSCHQAWFHL